MSTNFKSSIRATRHQVTVSGGANTFGTFQITARADDGTPLGSAFQVDVKPLKTISAVTFFTISDPTEGLTPPNVPSTDALLAELNKIYPRQANIQFTNVISGGNFSFHYDLDHDRALFYDTLAGTNPPKGCYPEQTAPGVQFQCRTSRSELGPIFDNFYGLPPLQPRGNGGNFEAFYVNKIASPIVLGYSVAGNPYYPTIVSTDYGNSTVPSDYIENKTAHEIGHILGRGALVGGIQTKPHNERNNSYLMWAYNSNGNPCRLSRNDWNIMNFVQSSTISPKE
jgi:hypothetical protein